jgi:diguanylate cyclase (GGDEF)-like protein
MTDSGFRPEQREQIRRASRASRARSQRIQDQALALRRRSRRLASLMADSDGGGLVGRIAFAGLPVPAALVDHEGVVARVNQAWRELPELDSALGLGSDFRAGWSAVSGDTFVGDAVAGVARTGTPLQLETAVEGESPRRVLMQIGPAGLGDEPGVLLMLVDITRQYERERQLLFDATHDVLTGVANRVWLQRALEDALVQLRRYGSRFGLIYLDLDRFKPLNDQYGHAAGDAVLQAVAERWSQVVRAPDLLARVGGDEFVVVVQHLDNDPDVSALASRLVRAMETPFVVEGADIHLEVTYGVAIPTADVTAEGALATADQAMYAQKGFGRR